MLIIRPLVIHVVFFCFRPTIKNIKRTKQVVRTTIATKHIHHLRCCLSSPPLSSLTTKKCFFVLTSVNKFMVLINVRYLSLSISFTNMCTNTLLLTHTHMVVLRNWLSGCLCFCVFLFVLLSWEFRFLWLTGNTFPYDHMQTTQNRRKMYLRIQVSKSTKIWERLNVWSVQGF